MICSLWQTNNYSSIHLGISINQPSSKMSLHEKWQKHEHSNFIIAKWSYLERYGTVATQGLGWRLW